MPSPADPLLSSTLALGIDFQPSVSIDSTITMASSFEPRNLEYRIYVVTPAIMRPSKDANFATFVTTFSVGTADTKMTGASVSPRPDTGTILIRFAYAILLCMDPISVIFCFRIVGSFFSLN